MSTETLKNLMNSATDGVIDDFAAPDVSRMIREGDRQRRRRRGLVAVGGLAAAAVATVGVVAVTGGSGDERSLDPAGAPAPVDQVSWTVGSTLNTPGATFDLGHTVAAYVRTTAGYAFADPDGVVYSFVGGHVTTIGQTNTRGMRLVADVGGTRVGWVQPGTSKDHSPSFVVRDLKTGEEQNFGSGSSGMGAMADEAVEVERVGLVGDTAYVRDSRGAVAVSLNGGEDTVINAKARNGFDIGGVGAGLISTQDDGASTGSVVAPPGKAGTGPVMVGGWGTAYISPDGRWVSFDADDAAVFDIATAKRITLDAQDNWFSNGYEWLDEDTLAVVVAASKDATVKLLTCELPSGDCDVAVPDLGTFDTIEAKKINVPLGFPLS